MTRQARVFALLLSVVVTPALAQRPETCSATAIASPAGLRAALDSLRTSGDPELRAALIAASGQPAVRWALELAADSAIRAPTRAAALLVLRYARWKNAIPELVRLAEPLRGEWVVWNGALTALAAYPYPELEPFWTDMVVFPRHVVREQALRGLAMSGGARSMLAVRASTHKANDAATLALVAMVDTLLHRPLAERDTLTFGWPPDSLSGRFVPSSAWRRAHPGCLR